MTYPSVTQFETRALEAQAQAALEGERRAARPSRVANWLQQRRLAAAVAGARPSVADPCAAESSA